MIAELIEYLLSWNYSMLGSAELVLGKFINTCSVNLENKLNSFLNTGLIILFFLSVSFVVNLQLL